MKPQDLRIGNIINFNGIALKVGELSNKPFDEWYVVFGPDDPQMRNLKVKGINPEPLSADWLVQFGFEKKESINFSYYKKIYERSNTKGLIEYSEITVNENCTNVFINDVFICRVDSVHQLQNIYHSLTGTELESL